MSCLGENNNAPIPNVHTNRFNGHFILAQTLTQNSYNPDTFTLTTKGARFFIVKCSSENEVRSSIKSRIWRSTKRGNKRLDKAFRERNGKGFIFLFFNVTGSGHFCGVAQMMSSVEYKSCTSLFEHCSGVGQFAVMWIYVKNVPDLHFSHIRLENNQNEPVTNAQDSQEIPPEKGKRMMNIIHIFPHRTSILDDIDDHYDAAKDELQTRRGEVDGLQIKIEETVEEYLKCNALREKLRDLEKEIWKFYEKKNKLHGEYNKNEMEEQMLEIAAVYGHFLEDVDESDISAATTDKFQDEITTYYKACFASDNFNEEERNGQKLTRIFNAYMQGISALIPKDKLFKIDDEINKFREKNADLDCLYIKKLLAVKELEYGRWLELQRKKAMLQEKFIKLRGKINFLVNAVKIQNELGNFSPKMKQLQEMIKVLEQSYIELQQSCRKEKTNQFEEQKVLQDKITKLETKIESLSQTDRVRIKMKSLIEIVAEARGPPTTAVQDRAEDSRIFHTSVFTWCNM